MAPVAATLASSHVEGVSDGARARELYKYYQPNAPINVVDITAQPAEVRPARTSLADDARLPPDVNVDVHSDITSSKISSPDTALTAFCQLVAWRTGAQRAMLSVIDANTQYFIAESTKTVDLLDNTRHAPGDAIWLGCNTVDKAGRLCERTIAISPTSGNEHPCFVVNDLSQDEQFNQLPFVTGPPNLRFYAGVPIITKRGIPIGSLFVVDDRVWPGLSEENIHFMCTMADTIMNHLEMSREVEAHRRGMKMSRGLASFVEGRSQLIEPDVDADEGEGLKIVGQFETDSGIGRLHPKSSSAKGSRSSQVGSVSSVERKEKEYSESLSRAEEGILLSQGTTAQATPRPSVDSESQHNLSGTVSLSVSSPPVDSQGLASTVSEIESEATSMKVLFSRAANLIMEAFEIDGGAVFYDAQRSCFDIPMKQPESGSAGAGPQERDEEVQSSGESLSQSDVDDAPVSPRQSISKSGSPNLSGGSFTRSSQESKKAVEILGFATAQASSIHGETYPGPHAFVPFDEKSLNIFLSRYPRGKLWTFESDGAVSSSSEEDTMTGTKKTQAQEARDAQQRRNKAARVQSDAKYLLRHFPGVRQLLFVPLWDAGRSRWLSGCCVWSTEPTRILSKQTELAFLSAFGNSVMAEFSRIDTEIADQKKGDFIGSISHELRSPLHGILASAEFLGEEPLSGFERGLVETIDSCGRTLLDTINHILDFSKINHFEKNWKKNKKGGRPQPRSANSTLALRQSDMPMINLFADVDISIVCEEVVESVFAGHVFQNITAQTFDMVPSARGKMADPRRDSIEHASGAESINKSEVEVIFDVDVKDYHFTTQPGAFRRVIMNLLGNALKYTSHGYVRLTLESTEIEDLNTPGIIDSVPRSKVTLTVADTGRGIASEFLRSKLFTPFAQENSLSSGTGLGLSIVRSIVNLLEGEITIESEIGRGTQVTVTLPLLRDMPKTSGSSSSNTNSLVSQPRDTDESISKLRAQVAGLKASLCGFNHAPHDPVRHQLGKLLESCVKNFLVNWFGLKIVPLGQKADIIVANEADPETISRLSRHGSLKKKSPTILVLCSHSSRFDRNITPTGTKNNVGFLAKPVGPLKLARALLQCLDGVPPATTPGLLEPMSGGQSTSNDLSNVFEELSISPNGGGVLDNSRMASYSDNARKAIESPTPNATEKHEEYPFPTDDRPTISKSHTVPVDKSVEVPLTGPDEKLSLASRASDAESSQSTIYHTPLLTMQPPTPIRANGPSLLLVDDNRINLTLLRTYMRKRKYTFVEEAENGLEAVTKFEARPEGYDIIFMDISMPVLDGFGATRQIRAIEALRKKKSQELSGNQEEAEGQTPALVIALTGLASSQDQSEAFSCGIDLFLTKPVAFKEVGKMLDNWEANRERSRRGSVLSSESVGSR